MMLRMTAALLLLAPRVAAWGYCNDNNDSCANWAKNGECTKDHVKEMCPHSCSACPHLCRDDNPQCSAWADNKQCKENVDFMYKHCPASCGICKTKCYDKEPACLDWARKGECAKNDALLTICPVSCGVCTELCLDKQNDCPYWAADGQCGTNAAYALSHTFKPRARVPKREKSERASGKRVVHYDMAAKC